jgi:hypothetical protein
MTTLLIAYGRKTDTNLSRYSGYSEKTYRRQLNRGIAFERINQALIEQHGSPDGRQIAVVDCTFNEKSGRHTPGLDSFYNGKTHRVERGLEGSVVAVVDLDQHTGYSLSAQQTETGIAAQAKVAEAAGTPRGNRLDFYLGHLAYCQAYLPARVQHVVSDGFYTQRRWVDGVVGLGLHAVGKLRQDANLRYLYSGSRRLGPGAPKKYDGKITVTQPDLDRLEPVETLDDGTEMFTAIVWSVSLHRRIRWVYLRRTQNHKPTYAMLFASDLTLSARSVYEFYGARFQIEFIFRDARQFTGLGDCQSRQLQALDTHVNASLTALNLAKATLRQDSPRSQPVSFSIASLGRAALNQHLLDLFITQLDLDQTLIKSHPNFQNLCRYGTLVPSTA